MLSPSEVPGLFSENRGEFHTTGFGFQSVVFKCDDIQGKQAVMRSMVSNGKFQSEQLQVQL